MDLTKLFSAVQQHLNGKNRLLAEAGRTALAAMLRQKACLPRSPQLFQFGNNAGEMYVLGAFCLSQSTKTLGTLIQTADDFLLRNTLPPMTTLQRLPDSGDYLLTTKIINFKIEKRLSISLTKDSPEDLQVTLDMAPVRGIPRKNKSFISIFAWMGTAQVIYQMSSEDLDFPLPDMLIKKCIAK